MPFFGEALRSIHRPELARGRFTLAWNLSGMIELISVGSALLLELGTDHPVSAHGWLLFGVTNRSVLTVDLLGCESQLVWTHFPGWCLLQ